MHKIKSGLLLALKHGLFLCMYVSMLVMIASCAEMAEPIKMPFETLVGPWNRVLVGGLETPGGSSTLGGPPVMWPFIKIL